MPPNPKNRMATAGPLQQGQGEEPEVVSVVVATLLCYSLLTRACLFADGGKSPERGSPQSNGSQGLIWRQRYQLGGV
jgi:hypothetical protein